MPPRGPGPPPAGELRVKTMALRGVPPPALHCPLARHPPLTTPQGTLLPALTWRERQPRQNQRQQEKSAGRQHREEDDEAKCGVQGGRAGLGDTGTFVQRQEGVQGAGPRPRGEHLAEACPGRART